MTSAKQEFNRVNAQYSGLNAVENTLPMNPYKIIYNDSNGNGCYFLKNISNLIFE
jgi:hypothetical protein